jgi:HSP20 family protein
MSMRVHLQYPRIASEVLESLFLADNVMSATKSPAMNIAEYENELVAVVELPGVKKDRVKVTFEKGILTIEGQRKLNEISQGAQVLLDEIRIQDFSRSVRMNVEVDVNKITAELEDGILSVTLPKQEAAKSKQIEVKVK